MIYRHRPYDVSAERLTNGNWLVESADGRREVWYANDFDATFEAVSPAAYVCPGCGGELVYDTDAETLACARCGG